jgi:hypothetical protein
MLLQIEKKHKMNVVKQGLAEMIEKKGPVLSALRADWSRSDLVEPHLQ